MQPWGAIGDLEADASCKEEKEEEVWLKKQGHCKHDQSGTIRFRAPSVVAAGEGGCQGCRGSLKEGPWGCLQQQVGG